MDQKQYTLQNIFESPECLSQALMMAYANGTASDEEARKVEMHIIDCPLCEDAVDGLMMLPQTEMPQIIADAQQNLKKQIAEKSEVFEAEGGTVIEFRPNSSSEVGASSPEASPSNKKNPWTRYIGIAATVTILALLGIFMMRPSANSIADKYFDATVISSTRGMGTLDQAQFDKAVELYEAKSYTKAAPLFDNVDSIVATYFAGNCYFNSGEYAKAEDRFKSVVTKNQTWVEHAEYNLAMTYLKLGKIEEARNLLSKIASDDQQDFQNLAKEALEDVNSL